MAAMLFVSMRAQADAALLQVYMAYSLIEIQPGGTFIIHGCPNPEEE
jgi:hypothetical protein